MPDKGVSLNEAARGVIAKIFAELTATDSTTDFQESARLVELDIEAPLKASLANFLGHHYFKTREFERAHRYCTIWLACDPTNQTAAASVVSTLVRLRRWDEVVRFTEAQLKDGRTNADLLSGLCNALGHLGQLDEARAYGTLSLAAKDASTVAKPHDLATVQVPPFDGRDPKKNVIAFSLFGTNQRYANGARANAVAARFIYPSWICRFYVDEAVLKIVVDQLGAEGAQVLVVGGLPAAKFGTFWRFLVADDPSVERYIVRDCDSVVNVRERVAVDEWIESGRHFHLMRDVYTHTELILAGLWGGVRGALPLMAEAIRRYVDGRIFDRTLDQRFLREMIWPTMRQSVLAHDSQFAFGERRDFPRLGRLLPGRTVGEAIY